MTFTEWLAQYASDGSPRGDLARDIAADRAFPRETRSVDLALAHLWERCASEEAVEALQGAWADWLVECPVVSIGAGRRSCACGGGCRYGACERCAHPPFACAVALVWSVVDGPMHCACIDCLSAGDLILVPDAHVEQTLVLFRLHGRLGLDPVDTFMSSTVIRCVAP